MCFLLRELGEHTCQSSSLLQASCCRLARFAICRRRLEFAKLRRLSVMAPRGRSSMSAKDLAQILLPHATHKSFIKYDESDTVAASRLYPELIPQMHSLLQDLHNHQPNLSWTKHVWKEAFDIVFDEKQEKFKLKDEDRKAWVNAMKNRAANACRQVAQGIIKTPTVGWVVALPWIGQEAPQGGSSAQGEDVAADVTMTVLSDEENEEEQGEKKEVQLEPSAAAFSSQLESHDDAGVVKPSEHAPATDTTKASEFIVGYDNEFCMAWRMKAGADISAKELAQEMFKPEDALATDAPMAKFADGSVHHVSDLTCAELDEMKTDSDQRRLRAAVPCFFRGIHKDTHHEIVVKTRADRCLLVSMYEQGRQVLQVNPKEFGDPELEATVNEAGRSLSAIAKQFADAKLSREHLKSKRNELLNEFRATNPKISRKKPGAAMASDTASTTKKQKSGAVLGEMKEEEEQQHAAHDDENHEKKNVNAVVVRTKASSSTEPPSSKATTPSLARFSMPSPPSTTMFEELAKFHRRP